VTEFELRAGGPIVATGIETLQANLGYRCNLSCKHCHVRGGPESDSVMGPEVLERVLEVARRPEIRAIDLTGGAPEMNPRFRAFLRSCAALGKRVCVRTNLAILLEDGYRDIPDLYAELGIEVIASLPGYDAAKVDRQRGQGLFLKCVEAMRGLNERGYARSGTGLKLDLVHNPTGAYLPGNQAAIEASYRSRLEGGYGLRFDELFCIVNMPIGRFKDFLERSEGYEVYLAELRAAFNPVAFGSVMCRKMLSVGWDGSLYDCDFNQVLGLRVNHGAPSSIFDFDAEALARRRVVAGEHCYGCAAGAGSSCRGSIA
jgi:radical SAM/Cys-rich protein